MTRPLAYTAPLAPPAIPPMLAGMALLVLWWLTAHRAAAITGYGPSTDGRASGGRSALNGRALPHRE